MSSSNAPCITIGNSLPDLLDAIKLTRINITQDTNKMSVSLSDYVFIEDKLSKLGGSYGLNVTGVTVSDLDSLEGKKMRSQAFKFQIQASMFQKIGTPSWPWVTN